MVRAVVLEALPFAGGSARGAHPALGAESRDWPGLPE